MIDRYVKEFEVSSWDSHLNRVGTNRDIDNIIEVLNRNKIIYDRNKFKEDNNDKEMPITGDGDVLNLTLEKYVSNVSGYLKARGFDYIPDIKKASMEKALNEIK